jgi:hypothetical protein
MGSTVSPLILRHPFSPNKPIVSGANESEDGMTNILIQSLAGFLLMALLVWLIFGED